MNPTPTLLLSRDWLRAVTARQGDTEEVLSSLGEMLAADDRLLCQFADTHDRWRCDAVWGGTSGVEVAELWGLACERMWEYLFALDDIREAPHGRFRTLLLQELGARAAHLAEFMRTMTVAWEEPKLITPPELYEAIWTVRIPPLAYLRAMWNLFWSAIRHPLSDTTIDLSTGRVLYRS